MPIVYVLKHPDTNEIRYVGQTKRPLWARFASHIYDAKKNERNTPVICWIRKLIKENKKPIIECINPDAIWNDDEIKTIKFYREQGFRLLNYTDGGNAFDGLSGEKNSFYGKKHTSEAKLKMSDARKGKYCGKDNPNFGNHLSEESKKKISDANKGHKHNTGRTMTQETKDKLSKSKSRPIKCIDKEIVFESLRKAAEYYKVNVNTFYWYIYTNRSFNGLNFEYVNKNINCGGF